MAPPPSVGAADGSQTPDFEDPWSTLQWRYADAGRIIAYIGSDFQHDYRYDAHDQVVDFRLSYPDAPDLWMASPASTWIGTSYDNVYDAAERLAASTVQDYGDGASDTTPMHRVYAEDERGRCIGIETSTEDEVVRTEARSYDDDRLSVIEVTSSLPGLCANSTTQLSYDQDGRMRVRTMACDDGAVSETRHLYLADGSERVEIDDGLTDIGGESHIVITRTAPCLEIDRQIGMAPDARCRAP